MQAGEVAMRILGKWIVISLLTLTVAFVFGFVALIAWARHVTAPTQGGINVGEYMSALDGHLISAGRVGLATLAATGLYWLVSICWFTGANPGAKGPWVMKASLVLVPLALALFYAAVVLANEDPAVLRPPVRRGGD